MTSTVDFPCDAPFAGSLDRAAHPIAASEWSGTPNRTSHILAFRCLYLVSSLRRQRGVTTRDISRTFRAVARIPEAGKCAKAIFAISLPISG